MEGLSVPPNDRARVNKQSTEDRLQSDFRTVQSERARLQQLIDGLNNVNAENEKTRTEERIKLEKRADEVAKDKSVVRLLN